MTMIRRQEADSGSSENRAENVHLADQTGSQAEQCGGSVEAEKDLVVAVSENGPPEGAALDSDGVGKRKAPWGVKVCVPQMMADDVVEIFGMVHYHQYAFAGSMERQLTR